MTRTSVLAGHFVHGTLQQHGQPLANVTLRVLGGVDHDLVEVDSTTTSADGTFTFRMPRTLFFIGSDAPTAPQDWWSSWLEVHDSDWHLGVVNVPRGGAIRGRVVDADGWPVADAEIDGRRSESPSPLPPSQAPLARSGPDGTFRLDNLHPGGHRLRAMVASRSFAEHGVDVLEAGEVEVELRLPRGKRVTGIVVDWRGQPLPGARIQPERHRDPVTTDARGRFAIDHFAGATLFVGAPGHIEELHQVGQDAPEEHIALDRAVTLRGRVSGAGSAPSTLTITRAEHPAADAADAGPWRLLEQPQPVAADGTFAIDGLATSDYVVRAEAEGTGSSPPLRIALRDDATIELRIEPSHTVSVQVLDADGNAVDGAEIVVDPGIAACPSLYLGPDAKGVSDRIFGWFGKRGVMAPAGRVVLPIDRGQPLALGARHRDYLSDFRVFAVGEVPAEIVFVLPRAGTVRGAVRGGSVSEYGRSIVIWRLADDAQMLVEHKPFDLDAWSPRSAAVDADGGFVATGLEPGAWRAAVSRRGTATLGDRPDQQVGAVPLIDEGSDLLTVVDFVVVAGRDTEIELVDAPLGTLRGRVMLRGAPCAEAHVVGVRPGWRSWLPDESDDASPDWDSRHVRGSVAGQQTTADGSFVFRYRTAGPVELRVRHVRGAATSPPTTVVLPAPTIGMECTLELEAGSIAGSFATAQLPSELRRHAMAVLYPLHKAGGDPWYQTDYRTALSQYRAKVELGAGGRFAFDYLPAGDWLLRVECGAFGDGPLWQHIVTVQGEVVELGELQPMARVVTTVRWRWPAGDPMVRSVYGVWAYSPHGADARAIWVGTFPSGDGSTMLRVPPGRYTVEPFGHEGDVPYLHLLGTWGISGQRLAQPIAIEVHEDGRTTPAELTWIPLPPESSSRSPR